MTDKPQYRIRPARPADAALLPVVESSAGALFMTVPGYEWIARSEGHSETAFRNFIADGNAWVAADRQDQPAGFVLVSNLVTGLHINELSVSAAHQRQGLGRLLMERVQSVALARGCAAVTLTTFRDVEWNRPYYEHHGFEVCDVSLAPALEAVMQKEAEYGLRFCDRCAMIYRLF